MGSPRSESDERAYWPPVFHRGIWPVVALLLGFTVWAMLSNTLVTRVWGADPSLLVQGLWSVPSGIVQTSIALLVVWYEGVTLRSIGLSRREFGPALVAVTGFLILLNLVVVGLVLLREARLSVGLFALYRSPPLSLTWTLIAVGAVSEYVFVGPVEELAFRGYLQNKLVAVLNTGYSRLDTVLGIVGAAVAFSLLHVPTEILLDGMPLSQVVGSLALFVATGVTFGTIYAVTRNLYLVMFLHGIGNFWPLIVDPGLSAWPNWGVVLVLYALLALLYRRWAVGTSRLDPGVAPVAG